MKKVLLLVLLTGSILLAQPTINGIGNDASYITVGTWTQGNTGFGDHGIKQLKAYNDGNYLYVMIIGEAESNFNEIYLYINSSGAGDGVTAGTQLPAGNDGSSPFSSFRPTMDFQIDYAFRLSSGPSNAYVSIIRYLENGNTDTYLGGPANDGSVLTVSSGT
ncbi:MAG: hypothetical protein ACOYNS_15990, partial [Bacteroidota bacterium]